MRDLLFVVTHKEYKTPKDDLYKTISVGNSAVPADFKDSDGINISSKNPNYCELTAQYYVWKNLADNYDNIGLCHYRRYFADSKLKRFTLLTKESLDKYMSQCDVILTEKLYWKETCATIYDLGAGRKEDLYKLKEVIKEYYPEYLQPYENFLNGYSASYRNMFIMNKEHFCEYSKWLFDILEKMEEKIDLVGGNYSKMEARIYGYLSELLLNVYVEKNELKILYLPIIQKEASLKSRIREFINTIFDKAII